ncbi:MAG TPA: branched-chain amino acid ABC transporter permease, partial [Egibacteraceae bacterium]|nr:branched-chain amino acid ABC transporter permease [Egibacteraceae bacterium]
FFGVGAYFTGLTAVRFGISPFVTALAAGLFVAVLAAGLGCVALRVRGASFVIVTLALVYIGGLTAQAWRGLTGGSTGFTVPSPPSTALGPHLLFYYVFLALFLVILALTWWLRRSKFGLGLVAIREDEDKAEMLGINTMLYKLVAFTLSATFVGVGGGLYGHWRLILYPVFVFSIVFGVSMILSSLLGGLRSLWGPALGALLFIPGSYYLLTSHPQIHVLLTGALLGAVVLFLPDGIIPSVRQRLSRFGAQEASIRDAAQEADPELAKASK